MAEKKETTLKVVNPVYNKSGELITFDGIKLVDGKLDKSDAKSVELVEAVKKLPRTNGTYTGSSAPRVVIDGKTYALSYKFFTDKEVEAYKAYRDGHSSGSGSKPRARQLSDKEIAAWKEIEKACTSKAAKEAFDLVRPRTADELKIAALQAELAELLAKQSK